SGSGGRNSSWTGSYNAFIEQGKFVSNRVVLDFGLLWAGQIGSSQLTRGVDGGLSVYFTPSRPASAYIGVGGGVVGTEDVSTGRSSGGTAIGFGAFGFEGVTSPNSSTFFEARYQALFQDGSNQSK